MESFTDLDVWQKGMQLVKEAYVLTRKLPPEEQYGLTAQIRRAVVSILANLAEGFSRATAADKAHKYTTSRGECSEVKALLLVCEELGLLQQKETSCAKNLSDETGRLLSGLIQKFAHS